MLKALRLRFPRSSYIVSPTYDWIAFILAPLIALSLGTAIAYGIIPNQKITIGRFSGELWWYVVLVMTQSHLILTLIRAYGNTQIFSLFKKRFLLGPPILFACNYFSPVFLTAFLVINVFWDAYHSASQTFGFTRLYDIRIGNYSTKMRFLDRCLNILIYVGPILGGLTLIEHIDLMKEGLLINHVFFTHVPFYADFFSRDILILILIFTAFFMPYYVYSAWKASKSFPVSFQKVILLTTTAVVSILAWGFNTFGAAFLIMNFFHVWQYFAMIYWSEKPVMMKQFNLTNFSAVLLIVSIIVFFVMITAVLEIITVGYHLLAVFFCTINTCHFWFDGFIWSVKKKHIK